MKKKTKKAVQGPKKTAKPTVKKKTEPVAKKASSKKEPGLYTGANEPGDVDAWMQNLKHPMKNVAAELRKIILAADKNVGEGIYWNAPCFYFTGTMKAFNAKDYKRYIVGFNFFKQDCIRLVFLRGALVDEGSGLLEGNYADGRRLMLISKDNLKTKTKDLQTLVKDLVKKIPGL